jgi:hypothetical protein
MAFVRKEALKIGSLESHIDIDEEMTHQTECIKTYNDAVYLCDGFNRERPPEYIHIAHKGNGKFLCVITDEQNEVANIDNVVACKDTSELELYLGYIMPNYVL